MSHIRLFSFVSAILLLLLNLVEAQQSCINTCTGSANVLTQLKSCSGCGTDDWACFCRCPQYMNALFSCVEENCSGSDVTNSVVSFCANEGVSVSYSSGSLSIASSSISSVTSSVASSASNSQVSRTDASELSAFLATAAGATQTTPAATDTSGISAYLASAVPSNAETESSAACFVNSQYDYYSTPTWYTSLPTQAQSYYSSVNQGNTAACTLSAAQVATLGTSNNGRSGLSAGAIAGIVIGAILAALLLAALLWCLLRRRRRSRRNDEAAYARSKGFDPPNMSSAPMNPRSASRSGNQGLNGAGGPYGNHTRPVVGGAALGPRDMDRNHTGPTFGGGALSPNNMNNNPNSYGHHTSPMVGGAGLGPNNVNNNPNSFSTTTTTRTTIRSKPRNQARTNQTNQAPRPPPQPITNQALNDPHPNFPEESEGRRMF